jgi:hypothetical protein
MSETIKRWRLVYTNPSDRFDFWTDEISEQIGKLRSLVDRLPEDK